MNACTFLSPGYTCDKPRGPVRRNTSESALSTPNDKRGFVMSKISGRCAYSRIGLSVWGVVWAGLPVRALYIRKDARMAGSMFLPTTFHPMRVETQKVATLIQPGIQTMTAITQVSPSAAQTSSKSDSIPASQLQAVLGAFNATNLASSYIERGNFAAARRKLTLALAAINQLTAEA